MTFDDAFNTAARAAVAETVEGPARNWMQMLRLRARDRWRPTASERIKAVEVCRGCCRTSWTEAKRLPPKSVLVDAANNVVGFGPLTWLWIAVMVASLLANLKRLLSDIPTETDIDNGLYGAS